MSGFLDICQFNARYASLIDDDELEQWPACFTERCHYRITHAQNLREGLQAGLVYADSRAMLEDRVSALRQANIYERQRYRHILGLPIVAAVEGGPAPDGIDARTPFIVARIMHSGETMLFASGVYRDTFVRGPQGLLLKSRIVVCDSAVTDTLLALPL